MTKLLSKPEYEEKIAATRDKRMEWWRKARFGMFVHYGLYALVGRNEWVMARENYPVSEYEKLTDSFQPKPQAPMEWAKLAKKAGMKYMVMTTRHHDGFSLWDSEVNPYNSVNYGPERDIVQEFVDACREYDLKIGFYSSLMDWHHPDSWKCAYDSEARKRFNDYITELNRELMTQYGKIDILWYDVSAPMKSWEGWNSLERNQMMRELQPEIIINNRSKLAEDFGTPEGEVRAEDRDWEACMTFNDLSWGYVDSRQAKPYSYNAQRIIKMLNKATSGGGNLLLNIGPTPDGSVPEEAVEPLTNVGKWLKDNGEAVYGKKEKSYFDANGVCNSSWDGEKTVYLWNWIWPTEGQMALGGFVTPVKSIQIVNNQQSVEFEQKGHRIILKNLPEKSPDENLGIAVLKLEFEEKPEYHRASYFPQLHSGVDYAGENKI
ncbi:MAG: alpha-L-fucosidase [Bacillota bacterium]